MSDLIFLRQLDFSNRIYFIFSKIVVRCSMINSFHSNSLTIFEIPFIEKFYLRETVQWKWIRLAVNMRILT